MDIIPIIYIALIIVAVLTIFTLFYSFISFKQKQKNHDSPAFNIPSKIDERNKELIIEKKVIETRSEQKAATKQKKIEESIDLNKINVDGKEQKRVPKKAPQKIYKPNKRIKILNLKNTDVNPIDKMNHKSDQIKKNNEKLESLGNDILDKYTDERENDLFTLKVNEPKIKSKNK